MIISGTFSSLATCPPTPPTGGSNSRLERSWKKNMISQCQESDLSPQRDRRQWLAWAYPRSHHCPMRTLFGETRRKDNELRLGLTESENLWDTQGIYLENKGHASLKLRQELEMEMFTAITSAQEFKPWQWMRSPRKTVWRERSGGLKRPPEIVCRKFSW